MRGCEITRRWEKQMFDKLKRLLPQRTPDQDAVHRRLSQLMLGLNIQGAKREEASDIRRMAVGLAKIARKPGELLSTLKGIGDTQAFHHAETGSWLTPEQIAAGESGPFEACSLLSWLEIARKAGVAAVPATVILRLSDAETEAASGKLPDIEGPIPERIRKRVRDAIAADGELAEALTLEPDQDAPVDMEALVEKLHACMDEIHDPNVVVRSDQCGASTLKALACTGLVEDNVPEVDFGPDLQIGPGWIRNGNRRRVDPADRRLTGAYVAGPHKGMTFVVRPFVKASRYIVGRDPHRAGTPFDVPGAWPAEWRAFVKGGRVVGVSSYYCFNEEATPFTATMALKVRDLAQRVVDTAIAQGLEPRLMDVEHARRNPELAAMLEEKGFGVGTFSATLDFIETADGLLLLEAGPGHTPMGGGHPCGFAGTAGAPTMGNPMDTTGVAFRTMDHVLIGEPSTWKDGDRTGRILEWNEVEALAAQNTGEPA